MCLNANENLLELAKGRYIARMDADDLMLGDRLQITDWFFGEE